MKQVWLINHYAVPPGGSTGTRHYELARALKTHDWNMMIIASAIDHVTGHNRLHDTPVTSLLEDHDGVQFLWMRTPPYSGNGAGRMKNMLAFAMRVIKLAIKKPQNLQQRPDVIIGSTVHPAAAFAAWLLACRFRVPFTYEIRDLWPETLIEMGALRKGSIQARIMYAMEAWLFKRAKKVIAVLPGIPEYAKSRGFNPDKIVCIPNGVANVQSEEDTTANWMHTSDWDFTFMYFGAFGNANDLSTLLQAYHEFQKNNPQVNAGLRMIGDGSLKQDLQKLAQSLNIQRLTFEPAVPKSEVANLAKQADAFLITVKNLPRLYRYGISMNKLFDYMQAGKPIVIANCAMNDPVLDANAGISVPSGDCRAMAQAMAEIVGMSDDQRMQLGRNAQEYVKTTHSFDVLGKKLAEALTK